MSRLSRWHIFGACIVLGACLAAALCQGEYLMLPDSLDGPSRLAYRTAYWVSLPFRAVVIPLFPESNHHWSLAHSIVTGAGAPAFYAGALFMVVTYFRRRRRGTSVDEKVENLSRRKFLAQSATAAAGVGVFAIGGHAVYVAPQQLKVRRYTLPIEGLPDALDGVKLTHISDTHYGPFTTLSYLEDAMRLANSLKGDIVVLTGDYVHRSHDAVAPGIELFKDLEAPLGRFAVFGNHDHWEGIERCREAFESTGVTLVDNDRVFITERGARSNPDDPNALCLAGVGDYWEDEIRLDAALRDAAARMPRIVLSHNPDVAEYIPPDCRVDLMFSGHTHGGQVRLPVLGTPILPSRFGQRYSGGVCEGPKCPVVVSRAVGMAGLPLRFRVDPEIGLITLRRLPEQV